MYFFFHKLYVVYVNFNIKTTKTTFANTGTLDRLEDQPIFEVRKMQRKHRTMLNTWRGGCQRNLTSKGCKVRLTCGGHYTIIVKGLEVKALGITIKYQRENCWENTLTMPPHIRFKALIRKIEQLTFDKEWCWSSSLLPMTFKSHFKGQVFMLGQSWVSVKDYLSCGE